MKTFREFSDKELTDLTEEQIKRAIDLVCAQDGIPLLPPQPVLPTTTQPTPNTQVYKVGDFCFTEEKDALQVRDLINSLSICTTPYTNYKTYEKVIKKTLECVANIQVEKAYTQEAYDKVAEQVSIYAKEKEEYDTLKKEYNDAYNQRKDISSELNELISAAKKRIAQKNFLKTKWDEYVDLAEGDPSIAYNFMVKAYPAIKDDPAFMEEIQVDMARGGK